MVNKFLEKRLHEMITRECPFKGPEPIKENWWGELLIRWHLKRRRFVEVDTKSGETVSIARTRSPK